jgi:arylsulfatase A-like enzyme
VKPGVSKSLVEQVDIYPTIAGLAGIPVPGEVQGVSLQPLLSDPSAKIKPAAFSTMLSTHTKLMGHAITDGRFRYIEWDGGKGGSHLYDHETDPRELKNLADDPAQKARVAALKAQLEKHVREAGGE